MVRITPKEHGIVEAQIAQFASEHVASQVHRARILQNLSDAALTESAGDTDKPVTYQQYLDFMKDHLSQSRSDDQNGRREIFDNRAAILEAYDEFTPEVKNGFENASEYIAGGTSIIFELYHNGKNYMVRRPFPVDWDPAASVIDHHIAAAALTRNLPHFEKLVAASYEDGMTVAEKMPGKTFTNLELEDVEAITDIQLAELIQTVQEAERLGIDIDFNPENFLYDKVAGFGFIDLGAFSDVQNKDRHPKRLSEMLEIVIDFLRTAPERRWDLSKSQTEKDKSKRLWQAVKDVTERYKQIIESDLDQDMAKEASVAIGKFRDAQGKYWQLSR